MYSVVDLSGTRVFKAAESLSGGGTTAVALGTGGVTTAKENSVPIGLLTPEMELPINAGEAVNVQVAGGGLWLTGEDVAAGDLLSAGEDGKAFKATAGKYVLAQALQDAPAFGAAKVFITHSGFKE